MSFKPVSPLWLGKLPETDLEEKAFDVQAALETIGVTTAKEFLIYTFITTRNAGEGEVFQRGWYEIYTSDGKDQFSQFMNVAIGIGVTTIDSANLWYPMAAGKLHAKLYHPSCKTKSIKPTEMVANDEWSDIYIIGYRE